MLIILFSLIVIGLFASAFFTLVHDSLKLGSSAINAYKAGSLKSKFSSLGDLNGKTYDLIASHVGPATESYLITDASGAAVYRKIWKTEHYCIWIIFGCDGKFIAIEQEINS